MESARASGERVIVVVDANRSKGTTEALEWALNHVVRPGDAVVFLCILSDSQPRKKALSSSSFQSCFPNLYMGIGFASIWERLEFSVQGDMEPKVLEEEIMKRREEYHCHLQPFYKRCNKNNVELQVKFAAGFSPQKMTIEEARTNDTRWIVLDSHLKKDKDYIHDQIGCNLAVFKGNNEATIFASDTSDKVKLAKNLAGVNETTRDLQPDKPSNDDGIQTLNSKTVLPPSSPHHSSCPLSWRPGYPRSITHADLESITNKFSVENMIFEEDDLLVYQGILQETPVLVKSFSRNNERFQSELNILSRVRHRNILNLVGYCSSEASMFLLCDFPCNDFLDVHLLCDDQARNLSWRNRWSIALGICGCLRYLHDECQDRPIVHLALCSSHVALSHSYSPLLTNFTWAKRSVDADALNASSSAGPIKDCLSRDVYAYGLFLLELITGQPCGFDSNAERKLMVDKALPLLENGSLSELMDPRLDNSNEINVVHLMALAASMCLRDDSVQFPAMNVHSDVRTHCLHHCRCFIAADLCREEELKTEVLQVEAMIRGDRCPTLRD